MSSIDTLKDHYHKLFNLILTTGIFPSSWSESLLMPIYKKGQKNDTNNYRGIALSSCLSKVLLSIINKRITNYFGTK
ncbi:hypothetical protein LOTGIDRAFT_121226 [Lottia gigantea]|uniref:Reverse transcriptase domain-containing protein n=1 Tax=Lottia gigantea TaxID=225164 RepID=V3ZLN4_LOTGI|nr:hypothetical protein LOTGIDRAFT_121226 [Lottia gigantea]ESO92263.1 hypothetical protein LOTGIDRAFT_121226 [Lottia gigantea]